ncbi:MAG: hypothetical protein H6829_06080 [Planctomycetes bacterium]|nr:hypothetical protein [Planctomycetota bacterium]
MDETRDTNDTIYDLYEADCTTLLVTDWSSGLNHLTWSNPIVAAVTVIVRVQNFDYWPSTYDFDVSLQSVPCAPDVFEDNDDCSSAAALTAGSYTGLTMNSVDLADYYKATVPAGTVFSMSETLDTSNEVFWRVSLDDCATEFDYQTTNILWANDTGASLDVVFKAEYQSSGAAPCAIYGFDLAIGSTPCMSAADDNLEENDNCATAVPIVDGMYVDLFVSDTDKDYFAFNVRAGATVSIDIAYLEYVEGDVDAFLREATSLACGTGNSGIDLLASGTATQGFEQLTWTNASAADVDVVLEVLVLDTANPNCNTYDLVLTGSGDPGTGLIGPEFCSPMDSNSTGASTRLSGFWGSGVGTDLHFEVTSGPPTQFGYVLVGTAPSDPGLALSQGRLCLAVSPGNSIGRYNIVGGALLSLGIFDGQGCLQNLSMTSTSGTGFDLPNTVPIAGFPAITAGTNLYFQFWHREDSGMSNFSNGLSVTF